MITPMPDAFSTLMDGHRAFYEARYQPAQDHYRALADHGQRPFALVIACCDSRVAPEVIFNCEPGDILVVRTIANLVPAYALDLDNRHAGCATAAAIEFAVDALGVKTIVVMGHAGCGGVAAALAKDRQALGKDDFVGKWVLPLRGLADKINQRADLSADQKQTALEQLSVQQGVDHLLTYQSVRKKTSGGQLSVHGVWFDIRSGNLLAVERDVDISIFHTF